MHACALPHPHTHVSMSLSPPSVPRIQPPKHKTPTQHPSPPPPNKNNTQTKQLCVATLNGRLYFWDVQEGHELGSIDGRRDIAGGRGLRDKVRVWLHVVRVWMGGWVGVGDGVVDTGADSAHTRTNTPLTKQTIPKVTAETSSASKHFSSVAYSADGSCVIAGASCFGALYLYGCVPARLPADFLSFPFHHPPPSFP